VTKLAKWKTTAQMIAIAVLFLGTGLEYLNGVAMQGMTPEQYAEAVMAGTRRPDPRLRQARLRLLCESCRHLADVGRRAADHGDGVGVFREGPAIPAGRQVIEVLYFAWVRERIGLPREKVETSATTVAELVEELRAREERYAMAFADLSSLRVALDQELASFDAPLAGVREVAFFPPMTGG
jgi:molybdopterin synthase sulfur carrier subunit